MTMCVTPVHCLGPTCRVSLMSAHRFSMLICRGVHERRNACLSIPSGSAMGAYSVVPLVFQAVSEKRIRSSFGYGCARRIANSDGDRYGSKSSGHSRDRHRASQISRDRSCAVGRSDVPINYTIARMGENRVRERGQVNASCLVGGAGGDRVLTQASTTRHHRAPAWSATRRGEKAELTSQAALLCQGYEVEA